MPENKYCQCGIQVNPRHPKGFDHCTICEDILCGNCAMEGYIDQEDSNAPFIECKKCETKRREEERKARGEWTSAELEEQGQQRLL